MAGETITIVVKIMSKNYRMFYGEFSLKQWVMMLLKSEIILPEYQRFFTWKFDDVEKLIESFSKGYIVPPVIIADNDGKIYILDGQQRLSSILLSFLRIFPNIDKLSNSIYNSNSEIIDEDDVDSESEKIINWQLSEIQKLYEECKYDLDLLRERLKRAPYIKKNYKIAENFWDENFLGYAFSKRMPDAKVDAHSHFARTFHVINTAGTPLLPYESRRAYYWLVPKLTPIFEPDFLKNMDMEQKGRAVIFDFVRPLAFAADYYNRNGNNVKEADVAKKFGTNFERYFTGFVIRAADQDMDNKFSFFGKVQDFLGENIEMKLDHIKEICSYDNFIPKITAVYVYDYYFSGMVYWIIVRNKRIAVEKLTLLKTQLDRAINDFQARNPNDKKYNTLGRIRNRLNDSISIYEKFVYGEINV